MHAHFQISSQQSSSTVCILYFMVCTKENYGIQVSGPIVTIPCKASPEEVVQGDCSDSAIVMELDSSRVVVSLFLLSHLSIHCGSTLRTKGSAFTTVM